jgi:hypothetical protein
MSSFVPATNPVLIFSALKARAGILTVAEVSRNRAVHKSRQRRTPYRTAGRKLSSNGTVGETLLKFAPAVEEYFSI